MDFLSDLVLAAAAIGAAVYCFILSRRLSALSSLEGGMGSAIAVLSSQVDDLKRLIQAAQKTAGQAGSHLTEQTQRAENVAKRLELLVASMHDLPSATPQESLRSPSRWPADAVNRHRPEREIEPESPPARARVLRRRRENGGE
jgi:outer membrane murein-binding lipoprotein Lpp